jgi:hypothetical protein
MQACRNIQGHGDLFQLGHVSKDADYAHQLYLSPLCLESFRRTLIPFLSGFPLVLSSNLWCIVHSCDHKVKIIPYLSRFFKFFLL